MTTNGFDDPMARRSIQSFKMLNFRVIPTRVSLRPRAPLSSTFFRQQSRLRLKTQILGCGRVECRYTSTSSSADSITTSAPSQPPPKSWVERTPQKIRPYLYLARVDKPIGTLLLYYPCSVSPPSEIGCRNLDEKHSLVNYDGFVCASSPNNHSSDISESLRGRRVHYARSGMHDQRYVGSEFG